MIWQAINVNKYAKKHKKKHVKQTKNPKVKQFQQQLPRSFIFLKV